VGEELAGKVDQGLDTHAHDLGESFENLPSLVIPAKTGMTNNNISREIQSSLGVQKFRGNCGA